MMDRSFGPIWKRMVKVWLSWRLLKQENKWKAEIKAKLDQRPETVSLSKHALWKELFHIAKRLKDENIWWQRRDQRKIYGLSQFRKTDLHGYNSNFKSWKAVSAPKINGPNKERKWSTVVVNFTIQTRNVEDQYFTLQKSVWPTQIDGYMEKLMAIDDRGPALV